MAVHNLGQIAAEAWEHTLRTSPHDDGEWLFEQLGGPRSTYRERLDRQPRNYYGDLIPRIEIVKNNLRRLKAGY